MDILSKLDRSIPIRILLEDYAFVARKFAGHHKKLQELGGIFKYSLYTNNITDVECITPSRWKKLATGNGRITKRGMVEFIKANIPNIDVLEIFNLPECTEAVPTPVQDIADAIGIVLSYVHPDD